MRSRMACQLTFFWACFALRAEAAGADPLTLEWIAPAICPDGAAVRREVLKLADLDGSGSHRVNARVLIQRIGEQEFELRLSAELDGVVGERTFRGQSCGSITDAAVLTLALMLNPDAEIRSAEPAPAPQVTSAPRQPRAPHEEVPSKLDTEPRWPLNGAVAFALGIRTGVLPDPGLEVALAAGAGLGPLKGWLSGSAMPSQSAAISDSNAGGRMWVLSGGALAEWAVDAGMFEVGPALGVELTRVAGRGSGVSAPERASIFWTSATVGATGHWRVSVPFALGGGVFGLIPLARPSFYLEGLGPVLEPQVVGIRAHFSAAWLLL